MITPDQAWSRLARDLEPLDAEPVLRRAAAGRVLAAALEATVDVPPADVSAMDGYALAGEAAPGELLPVTGRIAAGDPPGVALEPGRAIRIMTGAPLPRGADRVVPVEQTDGGRERVVVRETTPRGAHIRRRGEVLRRGDPLLPAGALLTPGALALLATHGIGDVSVRRRPRVAVLATGDEVVPPDTTPGPGQLRNSHTDFLLAAGRGLGLEPDDLGIAPDRREALDELVGAGLRADVLLVTGGVSKGELDFVEEVLERRGCRILFDAVALQPGKPLVAARHPGGLVFGLPGNPASVMVCFWLFVRPALRRLAGLDDGYWQGALAGELTAPLPAAKGRDRFLAATVRFEGGRILVAPQPAKGSHDLSAYSRGTALVRVPAHAPPTPAGGRCEVLPLADWIGA